jgi:hypothetical protein
VLDDLAVLEADDVDLPEGDRLVGGSPPQELPGMPSMEAAVDDHGVAFADDLVDLKAPIGEPLLDPQHGLDMPSSPGGAPSGGSWLTTSGCITARKPATSPLGRSSSKVRRAMAFKSSAMTGSFLAVSK